jgi:HSP20 family molecular chaperone IbpA
MRYRKLSVRYTMVTPTSLAWPLGGLWQADRLRLLGATWWCPDADAYETAATVELVVDLAGVEDDDVEVQLFDDVLVIEGQRRPVGGPEPARYHVAGIRLGPFRLDLRLPAPVDADRVEARFERGLLRVTLPKRDAT